MSAMKPRLSLARTIDKLEHVQVKQQKQNNWYENAAKEADICLDEEMLLVCTGVILTVFVSSISSLLYFIVDQMYLYDHSNTLIILNCIISPTPKSLSINYIHFYNLITPILQSYSSFTPILQSLSINYN